MIAPPTISPSQAATRRPAHADRPEQARDSSFEETMARVGAQAGGPERSDRAERPERAEDRPVDGPGPQDGRDVAAAARHETAGPSTPDAASSPSDAAGADATPATAGSVTAQADADGAAGAEAQVAIATETPATDAAASISGAGATARGAEMTAATAEVDLPPEVVAAAAGDDATSHPTAAATPDAAEPVVNAEPEGTGGVDASGDRPSSDPFADRPDGGPSGIDHGSSRPGLARAEAHRTGPANPDASSVTVTLPSSSASAAAPSDAQRGATVIHDGEPPVDVVSTTSTSAGAGIAPTPNHPTAPVAAPTAAAPAPAAPVTVPVADQIVGHVSTLLEGPDGTYQMRIELQPAELGTIRLDVVLEGGVLHVRMGTDNPESRHLLAQAMPDLRQALEQSGVRAGQLDVGGNGAGHGTRSDDRADRRHHDGTERSSAAPTAATPTRPTTSGARGLDVLL